MKKKTILKWEISEIQYGNVNVVYLLLGAPGAYLGIHLNKYCIS